MFVEQGYLTEDMMDRDLVRWLYTAVTRATERLYLVNFHPRFFGEEPEAQGARRAASSRSTSWIRAGHGQADQVGR